MNKYIINPLIKLLVKNNYFNHLERLKKLQYLPKEELEKQQLKKLKIMLNHAYNNVPFYKKKFDAGGVTPNDLITLKDLSKFPITTKQELRDNFPDNVCAKNIPKNRFIPNATSGSTGMPFKFFIDKQSTPAKFASFLLFNSWFGIELGDKLLQISTPHHASIFERLINKFVLRKKHISIHNIKKDNAMQIVNEINRYKPHLIESYASGLLLLAKYMKEQNLKFSFKPKLVITTSEQLTESNRKYAESIFGFDIIQRYGSIEFCGHLAQECKEKKDMHLNTDLVSIEFVDDKKMPISEGKRGKMLISDLNNFAMPFVRYAIGDLGKYSRECKCKRTFPLIEIEAREMDIILSKKKEKISVLEISGLLIDQYAEYVLQFQIIQKKVGELCIRISPSYKYKSEMTNILKKDLCMLLPDFDMEINLVDEIPIEKNGKRKILISEIN